MPTNDLFVFMESVSSELANEYERIRTRTAEDPGTAGDQGEENWAGVFRKWLPPIFQVVTKGRILGSDGSAGPQVDVLVLSPAYPTFLFDKKLYLAAGVLAAFECKTTLTAAHIGEAFANSRAIRKLDPPRLGTPYRELHSSLLYGVLAHSHSWKKPGSEPIKNVETRLRQEDAQNKHPREMLDLVCIADLATWSASRVAYLGPHMLPSQGREHFTALYGEQGAARSGYAQHSGTLGANPKPFTPVGAMLSLLFQKLAWTNEWLRPLADYFRLADVSGSAMAQMRTWGLEIYSEQIRQQVVSGGLINGKPWDEWSIMFI